MSARLQMSTQQVEDTLVSQDSKQLVDSTATISKEKIIAEEDTIQALQNQLFQTDSVTQPTVTLILTAEHHIRVATLNINVLNKLKLPVLLTYIEKKNIDVFSLQDEKESKLFSTLNKRLFSTLIKRHYNGIDIQERIAPFSECN